MNKRIILLCAALIGATPVLHVAASAESMYKDLVECVILSTTWETKLSRLRNVRYSLTQKKYELQNEVVKLYAQEFPNKVDTAAMALLGIVGVVFGASACHEYYTLQPHHTCQRASEQSAISGLALGSLFCMLISNYVQTKIYTKKIKEIDAVLAKLDTLEFKLQKETR